MSATHPHYSTGLPCDCSFTAHLEPAPDWGRVAKRIEADAIEDLAGHRRLQSPAGQNFVQALRHMRNASPDPAKIEPLLPWLAREFRKGHLRHDWLEQALERHPVARALPKDLKDHLRDYHIRGKDPQLPGANIPGMYNSLTGGAHPFTFGDDESGVASHVLSHWGDFLRSGHPLADLDLNHHTIQDFHQRVQDWDQSMAEAAEHAKLEALQGGKVVHTTPDGYTVRQLTTPEELEAEGNAMGHCVGGYHRAVADGRSLIYSLRDPKGEPHVTTEISPQRTQSAPFDFERARATQLAHPNEAKRWPEEVFDKLRAYSQNPNWSQLEDTPINVPGWTDPEARHTMTHGQLFNQLMSHDREGTATPIPHGGEIVQIQGKANQEPDDKYKAQMADWFRSFPPKDRPGAQDDDDYIMDDDGYSHSRLDHPDLIRQYESEYGGLVPGDAVHENEYGLLRRRPQLPADYDELLDKIKFHDYGSRGGGYDTDHIDDIYRLARERGEMPQLGRAVEGWQQGHQDNFDEWTDMNYTYAPRYPDEPTGWEDPDGEDAEEGDEGARPYWQVYESGDPYLDERHYDQAEAEKAYDQEYADWESQHPGLQAVQRMYEHLNQHQMQPVQETPQGPETYQYTNDLKPLEPPPPSEPVTAALRSAAPLYKRWVFSPASGRVELADNTGEPLEVKYHADLAREHNEPNLVHGYAYPIGGGWRLTDWESRPVEDPYVVASVMRALTGHTSATRAQWEPDVEDWSRIHHGLPA